MGYVFRSHHNLGAPFLLVDETVFVLPKGGVVRLGKHHFKLIFVLDGEFEHEIDGLEGPQQLKRGDILVAPVVENHTYINRDPHHAVSVQVLRIFLDMDFLSRHVRKKGLTPERDMSDFILHQFNRVLQLSGGFNSEINHLIGALRNESEVRALGYRHRVRALCMQLMVEVARMSDKQVREGVIRVKDPGRQIVQAAREYILKHYSGSVTLGEIAWHVGKGEEHLARLFKRETGHTVFEYVREVRIHEAKTLLMNPAYSMTDIAARCGFNSLSNFSRTFRQSEGISASQYRQNIPSNIQ